MKKKLFILFLMIFSIFSFGQIQNIAELSTGLHENTSIIRDTDNNIIGYVYIFNKGLVNESQNQQLEYIILDNNLNKLTNGDFELPYHKKISHKLLNVSFLDSKLYLNYMINTPGFTYYNYGLQNLIIDLKSKNIEQNKFIRNFEIQDALQADELVKLNTNKPSKVSGLFTLNNGGKSYNHLFNYEYNIIVPSKFDEYALYDENFNPIFKKYMPKSSLSQISVFRLLDFDNDLMVYYQTILHSKGLTKMKPVQDELLIGNPKLGEPEISIVYNDTLKNTYSFPKAEIFKDKFIVNGELKEYVARVSRTPESAPSIGIRRTEYDFSGKMLRDSVFLYDVIFKDLGFEGKKDKNRYYLEVRDYFNFNDGSFSILFEQVKGYVQLQASKSKDYILANFNKDYNLKNYEVLEKGKNKFNDAYLFSQIDQENNEVIFFYEDYVKINDKTRYYLIINKLKDGVLTTKKMPFETRSSYLRFSKAKYGFILITEYNKDDKEGSVRIEKLNI